ncbi:phosphotransferase family protein [Agromyces archimandritae]|uniref:Phosphotransferase family protein n=1 Tax=Agromyces archimandritae TaxID=2781962 RepID=A0A975FKL1_9MICO|nr:phosphotransferase family protein [Agromyces archimandritae]QTX03790.1 phosphotransferase family protein [Agromyces archimandritae]
MSEQTREAGPVLTERPDGRDVAATAEEAARMPVPPLLVLDAVTAFLDERGLGDGPVEWARIGDGQSNATFLLRRGGVEAVLRRGPRPPLPPSAHDMLREARIQLLLRDAGASVAEVLAVCEDPEPLGVPFYLMRRLHGDVITDEVPARFDTARDRRGVAEAAVDALAALHAIDVREGPLAGYGRPEGYLERQVSRFAGLWGKVSRRELPLVGELAERLAATMPATQRHALVHGDFRLGNLMFGTGRRPEVAAVLDWELSTLGDPLADLGYLVATWSEASGGVPTTMELSPVTARPGFLDRAGLAERYERLTGADASRLGWYRALALWKSAVFSEAIYTRWLDGERPDDTTFAPGLEAGVPRLLEVAAEALAER